MNRQGMIRKSKDAPASAVDQVRVQTEQAAALARISGQELLADPRLNPATRGHADTLRTDQHLRVLDAEHARLLRRHRVMDARAAEAERTLEAIALARRASSPARSVMALHSGRRTYARLAVAASVVLAAGSAMGVEAAAHVLDAPRGTGYVAELGLTGLSTAAITYRAHLAEHRGDLKSGTWQARSLWVLMIVPLLVSVAANLATTNALGAACSVGAAAFALLGAVVADRSAAAMQARAAEVDAADEDELHATATGRDLVAGVASDGGRQDDGDAVPAPNWDAVSGEARAGVDELAAWLADREPPEEGAPAERPAPSGDSPAGAARDPGVDLGDGGHVVGLRTEGRIDGPAGDRAGHIDRDHGDSADHGDRDNGPDDDPDGGARRVQAAAAARRAAGDETRKRVAAYLDLTPGATVRQIADALEISDATAKRHRRALREASGVEL
jgi:hypothetical protein